MEILITHSCAHWDTSRAYSMSALWTVDRDHHVMRVCAYASWYATTVLRREISFHKLLGWLKRKGRFAQAIDHGALETLCRDLRRDMAALLCKQKRNRKTSQQLLEACGPSRESCAQGEPRRVVQAA